MLLSDWRSNSGSRHVGVGLVLFRLAQLARARLGRAGRVASVPYRIYSLFLLGMDVPTSTKIGPGFRVNHGQGLVIHNASIIGADVTVRQAVTIGTAKRGEAAPRIGNRVNIGAGAIIIGNISIGDDAQIGAGAVVLNDVPAGAVVVGNPGRIVRRSDGVEAGGMH